MKWMLNSFSDTFQNLYNLHFPLKTTKFNKNLHCIEPWMSAGLLISRSNKLNLASISARNPSVQNIQKFKNFRNVYNATIGAAKKLYYEKTLQKNH